MEVDLAWRGVDLLSEFQDLRVRYLLNLVQSLPRDTLSGEAMSQDDEVVEALAEGQDLDDMPAARIRMSEFSPQVEALFGVVDRLGDVVSGLAGMGGKKPPRIPPMKRPETAWERIAHKRQIERHERLVARVLPNG